MPSWVSPQLTPEYASAVVAYTRGSIHVGETIAEIDDEHAAFGIPLLCLVHARWAIDDSDRLDLLLNHPACTVLADDPVDWRELAETQDIVGRLDAASAAWLGLAQEVGVLAGQPGIYAGLAGGGSLVIEI